MNELILEKNTKLPHGWTKVRLAEIAIINPSKSEIAVPDTTEVSFIPMKCVEELSGKIDLTNSKTYGEVKKGFTYFQENDILFAKITPCMENGKIAIVSGLINKIGFGSTEFHVIRMKNQKIFNRLYFWYLLQESFRKNAQSKMKGTAGQLRVPSEYLKDVLVPFPPLNEQKKIVAKIEELFSILDNLYNLLEQTRKQIRIYQKILIFNALSGDRTSEWRNAHPHLDGSQTLSSLFAERKKILGKKYLEIQPETQDILTIPKSWQWTSLHNITKKITDGTHHTPTYTDNGIAFLSVKDIKYDKIDFTNCKYISQKDHNELVKRCNPEFNDVLITKSGTIGRTAVVDTNEPFSLFVSVALLKIFTKYCNPYYLTYVLKNFINHIDISQKIKGGVIKNFHLEDLRLVPVPFPPLEEQNEIVNQLDYHMMITNNYELLVNRLQKKIASLRSSVLKQAFEGKLVPQDPNDEPAESLLEKIKQEKQQVINAAKPRKKKK